MQIAVKFNEDENDVQDGVEMVIFRAQMLRDVYYHESEPIPPLPDFLNDPLQRNGGQKFWVYRQGTYLPNYVFFGGELFVGHALKADLDHMEPTMEGYSHVTKLWLAMGGKLSTVDRTHYTLREQQQFLRDLYVDMQRP